MIEILATSTVEIPNSVAAVFAAGGLSWMAWMAKQLTATAQANRATFDGLKTLEANHDRLRTEFDQHIAAGRERYIGQLEQRLADRETP